jgi:hypothetical protein
MRNRALPALAIAVLLEAAACAEPAPPIAGIGALNALALSTGTSFGMCAGYCVTELRIAVRELAATRPHAPAGRHGTRAHPQPDRRSGACAAAGCAWLPGLRGWRDRVDPAPQGERHYPGDVRVWA